MKLLAGKVVLITGATRGIGRGLAESFAQQGADIAFTNISQTETVAEIQSFIESQGVRARFYEANAASFDDAQRVIDDVVATFGKIDVLVNNAGITIDGLLLRMTEEQWSKVIHVNLDSAFYHIKHAIRHMMKQRSGSIINITSVVGVDGNAGQANYAASKAGMIGLTKSVAKELGSRNIRCNAVAPGFIQTEMTAVLPEKEVEMWKTKIPLQRPGTKDDVSNVCLFLASDLSSYVTGQVLHCDGGMIM
ncbi:MAG: 3-oxoacyl-[acyl-carrier-protein] reductase [Bacteroidia bacterium]|nr:3-oxoacyl-[acyl-carrier-protein] reductase [Bacteroidia bacterium]